MRKPIILITGGTGFVGRFLARKLQECGFAVLLAVRKESNMWKFAVESFKSYEFITTPLEDGSWVNILSDRNVGVVIHLATYGSYPQQNEILKTLETNLFDSMRFLLSCTQSGNPILFISAESGAEYSIMKSAAKEISPLFFPNIYGRTKATFGLLGQKVCEGTQVNFFHLLLLQL